MFFQRSSSAETSTGFRKYCGPEAFKILPARNVKDPTLVQPTLFRGMLGGPPVVGLSCCQPTCSCLCLYGLTLPMCAAGGSGQTGGRNSTRSPTPELGAESQNWTQHSIVPCRHATWLPALQQTPREPRGPLGQTLPWSWLHPRASLLRVSVPTGPRSCNSTPAPRQWPCLSLPGSSSW